MHNLSAHVTKETLQRRQAKQAIWSKSQGLCWYCGVQTVWGEAPLPTQFCPDHVVPVKQGGTNALANMVPACQICNARKGALTLEAFRAREAQRPYPLFTPEHVAYLERLGVVLPPGFPCYPPVVFWFERS